MEIDVLPRVTDVMLRVVWPLVSYGDLSCAALKMFEFEALI